MKYSSASLLPKQFYGKFAIRRLSLNLRKGHSVCLSASSQSQCGLIQKLIDLKVVQNAA